MKIKIENLHVDNLRPLTKKSGHSGAIGWEVAGRGRFHIWCDFEGGKIRQGSTLFINPPTGVSYRMAGYFNPRRLNPNAKVHRDVVAHVIERVKNERLYEKAVDDLIRVQQEEDMARIAASFIEKKKERAVEMFDLLKRLGDPAHSTTSGIMETRAMAARLVQRIEAPE